MFLTHYFHPEVGAAQTRILETARLLRDRGHAVTVLTGLPNYPDGVIADGYRGRLTMTEDMDGLRVVRAPIVPAPNRGFAKRVVNHTSFAVSSLPLSVRTGSVDAVIAESPPLFTAGAAVAVARGRRAPLVLNVSDLWPESAVQLGMLSNPRAIRAAEALERFAYRHSAAITVPTPGMVRILREAGQPEGKVVYLPNAVDTDRFSPHPPPDDAVRRILYSGTVGLAQGVGTMVEAARELSGEGFTFDVYGDGAEREQLERDAAGLDHVTFHGRVSRDRVPGIVEGAGMCVMSLRDVPLFEDAVPTKMLEYMAAGKPVVAAAAGQAARLVRDAEAGEACPPEDPPALADAIRRVAADPERARRMGLNGRRHVEQHLSRRAFVDRLEDVLQRVTSR